MESARDDEFMGLAMAEAARGGLEGEVPVGAALVAGGRVVALARNRPIALGDATAHAEVLAIRAAGAALGSYRLGGTVLYVTLEPCVMCIGAIVNARIGRLVFGARDEKAGAVGSVYDIGRDGRLNHRVEVRGGLREAECGRLLSDFFAARRATW